jgi:hypothetical protein
MIAAVVVLVLIGGFIFVFAARGAANPEENSLSLASVNSATATGIPATATPIVEPSATPTDEPTIVPDTVVPSSMPDTAKPATVVPTVIPPTAIPTEIPASATPTAIPATPESVVLEDAELELRYNDDTLVVLNRSGETVSLTGLQFVQLSDADPVLFAAWEWAAAGGLLESERCVQVWRTEFVDLPETVPPADVCLARSAFRSTVRQFWIADNATPLFEVWREDELLGSCPTVLRDSPDEQIETCRVDL